ncbi:hypothetical protein OESDEN_03511 [Oesophagostomum dentatum]|uniref:Uncharacterized protein n=1 Tax=Oesophagostomum dentatum TaxID=61180 RepID=A0A0B1TGZ2_OESDE|nr:hypothetical protein OESDEN_03511 [Oesophagostomum dentatum]
MPRNDSCICQSGMEYTYTGSLMDVIGSFYCMNNADLCIEDLFGRQWRPAQSSNLITLVPSVNCLDGNSNCGVFLLFVASRPSSGNDLVSSTAEGMRYLDMTRDGNFVPFSEHVYVPIRGFSCDMCREQLCRPQ